MDLVMWLLYVIADIDIYIKMRIIGDKRVTVTKGYVTTYVLCRKKSFECGIHNL